MAPRPEQDPRVTDLRRYRRERERAERASRRKPARGPGGPEPLLGRRRHAGLILLVAILVLAALVLASEHRF